MGLIKEPKNVDFSTSSAPWSEQELEDFRKLMKKMKTNSKAKNSDRKLKPKVGANA